MRAIKFRAWTGKQMMYQDKQYLASFIRRAVVQINLDHGSESFQHESYLPNGGDISEYLMQCTGLTDKHGKDIYEGDIISRAFADGTLMSGDDSIVKFGKVDLGVNMHEYPYWVNGFYAEEIGGNPSESVTNAMLEGNVLVIGNIHETPELMVQP